RCCTAISALVFFVILRRSPRSPLFPYTTLFRSTCISRQRLFVTAARLRIFRCSTGLFPLSSRPLRKVSHRHTSQVVHHWRKDQKDRKSTRLNSSHVKISYAVFCLKKKNEKNTYA